MAAAEASFAPEEFLRVLVAPLATAAPFAAISAAAAAISAAAAAAAAAVSAASLPVGPGDPSAASSVSMYGARSNAVVGKSTCALSFERAPVPRHVNRLRCRHKTGGSVCSRVCFVAPPTCPHRSQ